jgi:surfeit locus 1 family protein
MRTRGGFLLPAALALAGFVGLIALGAWQIERKAWKEALIATLDRRLGDAPAALPPSSQWSGMTAADWEFVRVRLRIEPTGGKDALVYTAGSALRDDVKRPGYFVFAPVRLPSGGAVTVDRGYVPTTTYPLLAGPQEIIGVLRWPEAPSRFVADHDTGGAVWHVRDPGAMAEVRGWGTVAPFYIEQESPVPPGGLPHPAPLKVRLHNDHLQYAITWFGLAAVLAAMFAVWTIRRRREAAAG